MDNKNDDKELESYKQEIDESTLSNPFSNAFKNLLQKLHLIKSDQKLIGDEKTNSRGYQITSKDPLAATDKKSLKAILRTAFEAHQQKRAEKIRAKNATNTIQKYTIGKQEPLVEQIQTSKDVTQEFIRPQTAAEKAAMRAQNTNSSPTIEKLSVDKTVVENVNKSKLEEGTFESDSSAEGTPADIEIVPEVIQTPDSKKVIIMAENIVTSDSEHADDSKSKSATKGKDEPDQRDI